MIRVNLGNFMSSECFPAMVCGARFSFHRANCLAGLLLLTPKLRVNNDPIPGRAASVFTTARRNRLSRRDYQEPSHWRGIAIFSIFLLPGVLTACLPSILLWEKPNFRGPFFSTSCEFPTSIRPRKSGQKRAGAVNLLENSGQYCAG